MGAPEFSRTMTPDGVPLATVTEPVKEAFGPAGIPAGGKTVVLAIVTAVGAVRAGDAHAVMRFATFTDPSPVARSYPGEVMNAGVVPPALVV